MNECFSDTLTAVVLDNGPINELLFPHQITAFDSREKLGHW